MLLIYLKPSMEAVPGWLLSAETIQGTAEIRVRQGDSINGGTTQTVFSDNIQLVVPPYLSAGTWYVEVVGDGATQHTLSSEMVKPSALGRCQAAANDGGGSGLSYPIFGDTEINDAGVDPDANEEGVALGNGLYHLCG